MASKAATMAADWWTERLRQGDKEAFRTRLTELIDAQLEKRAMVSVSVDYDPDTTLIDALKAAGVECRGFLFSADDIFPRKHDLLISKTELRPKEGYGNWTDPIPVPNE